VSRDRRHRQGGMGSRLNAEGPAPCPTTITAPGAGDLPRAEGAYILILYLPASLEARVGSLGALAFEPGLYAYVGSARGPGGLRGRVSRHLRRSEAGGARRWHVDYLLHHARVEAVVLVYPSRGEECLARECLSRLLPGPRGFGSTDRRGDWTHFYRCPASPEACLRLAEECGRACCLPPEPPLHGPGEGLRDGA